MDDVLTIEAIQSRAAIVRFSRLTNEQLLTNLLRVCEAEKIAYSDEGLEAILFTAEGDMRHALNNLQASNSLVVHSKDGTNSMITARTVFQVCDQPHPTKVRSIVDSVYKGKLHDAIMELQGLWNLGYSARDIIGTLFKVTKAHEGLSEGIKLEFLREIGFCHMRIVNGVDSLVQLLGLISRMCQLATAQSPEK